MFGAQVSKAIRGEKGEEEPEPDSSAENGDTKVSLNKARFVLYS